MGFYSAVATFYAAVCYVFARFFVFLMLWLPHRFLRIGMLDNSSNEKVNKLTAIWTQPRFVSLHSAPIWADLNFSETIAAFVFHLVSLATLGLLVSFLISFYFSANTIIYCLLRNQVDGTALDDVYIHLDDIETDTPAVEPERQ